MYSMVPPTSKGVLPHPDLSMKSLGVLHKSGSAVALQRVQDVDQMMWNLGQLISSGFGRADVHATVDQGGVHTDDFDVHLLRNGQGQGCFAGPSGQPGIQVLSMFRGRVMWDQADAG